MLLLPNVCNTTATGICAVNSMVRRKMAKHYSEGFLCMLLYAFSESGSCMPRVVPSFVLATAIGASAARLKSDTQSLVSEDWAHIKEVNAIVEGRHYIANRLPVARAFQSEVGCRVFSNFLQKLCQLWLRWRPA